MLWHCTHHDVIWFIFAMLCFAYDQTGVSGVESMRGEYGLFGYWIFDGKIG